MPRVHTLRSTGLLNIALQLGVLIAAYAWGRTTNVGAFGEFWENILLAVIAIFPAILWAFFFNGRDRREPEPAGYLLTAAIAGMSAAVLAVMPLENYIFVTDLWSHRSLSSLMLSAVCVHGLLTSMSLYAILRYGFFNSPEFDEPVDGMVYGAFIGVGQGCMFSIAYLSGHRDFFLFPMLQASFINLVAYSSIGALIGYFIGEEKFIERRTQSYSIIAIAIGMILLGVFRIGQELVLIAAYRDAPWLSTAVTAGLGIVTLVVASGLTVKLSRRNVRPPIQGPLRAEPVVIVVLTVLLALAGTIRYAVTKDILFERTQYPMSFSYPWWFDDLPLRPVDFTRFYTATDRHSAANILQPVMAAGSNDGGRFVISVSIKRGGTDISALNLDEYVAEKERLSLSSDDIVVGGRPGKRLKYSFLVRSQGASEQLPQLYGVYQDIVPADHSTIVFKIVADRHLFHDRLPVYERLLSSVHWREQ